MRVSVLTKNASVESGLIVAELRAGKINLDAARAKIVALNLETERLIAATVQAQATAMGRTINPANGKVKNGDKQANKII